MGMRAWAMLLALAVLVAGAARGDVSPTRVERSWWPDGTLRLEATYVGPLLHGPYRLWYRDGQPYQTRHYVGGREQGAQRAWTPDGDLYVNYEVWNGRRYGFVNAQPCLPVTGGRESGS